MSTKTKIAAVALTALTLAGSMAITSNEVQAKGGHKALAIGLGAAALVGIIAANSNAYPTYGYGYRRCHWEPSYDAYGEYVGKVRVCNVY